MSAFGFTADDLPSNQAKRNIIEIFNNNELYEIKPDDFVDTDVYNQDFNQKLYKFFTYGYIKYDYVEAKLRFYDNKGYTENDSQQEVIKLIKNTNDTFLNELLTQKLITQDEKIFLTHQEFTKSVYDLDNHLQNVILRISNPKYANQLQWIMYDNIIKCIIYRLYLKLYPSDSKTGDENSLDNANEKKEDIQRKLQALEEKVRTYKKLHSSGGRTKKTIKNKLKKRKTKKMKINKKNKRRH
jgi:hypothetical protein